jgi:AcrR family transcriptional regulator
MRSRFPGGTAEAVMGEKRDPKRKAAMLSAFADYLLQKGVSDLSLRPAAAALGTSARMLLYYFGTREQLLVEAMGEIRTRERAQLMAAMHRSFRGSTVDIFRDVWQWYASEHREPYLRLLFELYGRAFVDPDRFQGFLDMVTDDYFMLIEEGLLGRGLGHRESTIAATLYRATFRGLLIDLLSTGDRERIDMAVKSLGENFERDLLARIAKDKRRRRTRSPARASAKGAKRSTSPARRRLQPPRD